jgi:hypothetical protein
VGVDDAVRDTCEDSIEKNYAERYTWGTMTVVALGVEGSGFCGKLSDHFSLFTFIFIPPQTRPATANCS